MRRFIFILAGGSGTRFWPISRDHTPKQLLKLFGKTTLLELALKRAAKLTDKNDIHILTNEVQRNQVLAISSKFIPDKNVICEPARRDTAAAAAIAIGISLGKEENSAMALLPSDHLINDEKGFIAAADSAFAAAAKHEALATIGVKPTWACSGYGYIELGDSLADDRSSNLPTACVAKKFHEKPTTELAQHYLESGNYAWNAGMFFWNTGVAYNELKSQAPELAKLCQILSKENLRSDGKLPQKSRINFLEQTPISIDFALMEKANRVVCVPANFDWNDIGAWQAAAEFFETISQNQSNTRIISKDSKNNIIFAKKSGTDDKLVALLGVENLLIADAGDTLLIADKSRAEDIKKIVAEVPPELR